MADFKVMNATFVRLGYAQNLTFRIDQNFGFDCMRGLAGVVIALIFGSFYPLFGSVDIKFLHKI